MKDTFNQAIKDADNIPFSSILLLESSIHIGSALFEFKGSSSRLDQLEAIVEHMSEERWLEFKEWVNDQTGEDNYHTYFEQYRD